jgi:hypothetical protein
MHPVGVELFHADGQTHRQTDGRTDRTKLIVTFRNFANVPQTATISKQILLLVESDKKN